MAKKNIKVLSTASIAGMIATAVLSSQAFAAVDAYVVKVGNDVFEYDRAELSQSYLDYKRGNDAPLFEDYTARMKEGKLAAFHDDVNEYVSYDDVASKFLEAKRAGEAFVADDYTESEDAEVVEVPTVKKVVVKDGEVVVEDGETPVQGELKVESVSAINLKQIQVKFNKEVDEDSAEDTSNYGVTGMTVSSAVLEDDNKTVTLNLSSGMANYEEYTVTIEDVEAVDGEKVEDTEVEISTKDVDIPQVSSIETKGNKVVEIKFSEPVNNVLQKNDDNLLNIFLDDKVIDVDSVNSPTKDATATLNADGTKLTLVFENALTSGEHEITIKQSGTNSIVDYAGYRVAPFTQKVNVQPQLTVPAVEKVTVNGQTKVTVEFSKGMAITNSDLANIYWNTTGNDGDTSKNADSFKKVEDNVYEFKFTTDVLPESGDFYLFFADIVDNSGNKIAGNVANKNTYKVKLAAVADAAPEVTSVKAENDKKIVVKFNNDMDITSAQKKANYTLVDPDGEKVTLDKNPVYNPTNKEVTIAQNSSLTGGEYKLTIQDVKDVTDKKVSKKTFTFTVTDSTAPTVKAVEYKGDTIILSFNESLTTSGKYSATNKKNYKYDGAELPVGTDISYADKKVTITLPSGTWDPSKTLTIGYFDGDEVYTLADASGNLLSPQSKVIDSYAGYAHIIASIDISDDDATLKVDSKTELVLTLPSDAPEFKSAVAGDFEISVDNGETWFNPESVAIDEDNARKLIFTVSDDDEFIAADAGENVKVKTKSPTSSKDVFGANIVAGMTTTVAATNDINPVIKAAVVNAAGELLVTFDATIDTTSTDTAKAAIAGDLVIVDGDDTYTGSDLTVSEIVSGKNAKTFKVTKAGGFSVSKAYTVKTVGEDFINAVGANGAKIAANTDGIQTAGMAATSITFANNGTENTLDVNDTITITFNRAIDFESISSDWDNGLSNVDATIDENGELTFDNVNIGTIAGLENVTAGEIKVDLTKGNDYQLVIKVTNLDGTAAIGEQTTLSTFEASEDVKSKSGVQVAGDTVVVVTDSNF